MWNDAVSVSTLPHPISMFLLGFFLFAMIFLFIEFKKISTQLKEFKSEFKELENKLTKCSNDFDTKLSDVSKKVDSRVDKAIIAIKKANQN
jgi:predicted PurR-regulated permease PerM